MKIKQEYCCTKEAELYLRMIPDIPLKHRPMFATVAYSYLLQSFAQLREYGDETPHPEIDDLFRHANYYCQRYPLFDQDAIDRMNIDAVKDEYTRWCQKKIRFLNIFNEISHYNPEYARDEVCLDLDERHQWLLDDIIRTYDHCRRTFFRISPEEDSFQDKSRDEDVECMIDCFTRLYTLLDKASKLIRYLFPRDEIEEKASFYDVAEKYANSPNPYLKAIYHLCCDIFPDRYSGAGSTFDPRNNYYGLILKRGFLRNSIMHGTVKVYTETEDKTNYWQVASVSAMELAHCTNMMMYDVRELILNIELAYQYRKSNPM